MNLQLLNALVITYGLIVEENGVKKFNVYCSYWFCLFFGYNQGFGRTGNRNGCIAAAGRRRLYALYPGLIMGTIKSHFSIKQLAFYNYSDIMRAIMTKDVIFLLIEEIYVNNKRYC